MSAREWEFSPLAFKVLWRAAERDTLPYPLQYRSTFATVSEYEAAWKAEADDLHRIFDEELYGAMRVLAEPEARIEVAGEVGGDRLRAHAAVHNRHAVLLVQEPTGSPYRGGAVRMTMFDAEYLPRRLVTVFPDAPRGSGAGLRVSRREVEIAEANGASATNQLGAVSGNGNGDGGRSAHALAAQFFDRPRDLVVHVAVYPGPSWDQRPAPARGFHVMDYPDGRYLVRSDGDLLEAEPVDRSGLGFDLERVIRFAVAGHREEHDPSYH
ncbi:ESX secretion-associated protein EspG [Nocardia bovistercoris]|uniref:ESX secretion-associated protein EspG n=1 Tax=Nocardia bovistercoris TaxID=2785916 RepID=A0A931N371_9NOCA|nr:ESX secretion-associated protein EspG [Nocardia bovistercoris]MBH0776258.1 ESX secretion-associated protein EspG [Nocardia bovistercoris]